MSRAVKDDRRSTSPKVLVKAEPTATPIGPAKFDGRSNLRGPSTKEAVNRDEGTAGRSLIATRVP